MQYGDLEVAELGTKPVPAGAMLGQRAGRSPEAVPVLPIAPSELTGEHCCGFPASRLWPCRDPASALGSGQGQTINHGSSDATCRL